MFLFKKTLIILIIALGLTAPVLALAAADPYGLQKSGDVAGLSGLAISQKSIPQLAGEIIGVGLSLVGIIFFLLMLYAGVRWMIAAGRTEEVQKAKETLEAAAIGLVIVLAAYAITQFVFSSLGVGGGATSSNTIQGTLCQDNTDCPSGQSCIFGACSVADGSTGGSGCSLDSECGDGDICYNHSCSRIEACDSIVLQTECVGVSTCDWKVNNSNCKCKNIVSGQVFPACGDFQSEDLCDGVADSCVWECGNCQAKKRN